MCPSGKGLGEETFKLIAPYTVYDANEWTVVGSFEHGRQVLYVLQRDS